MTANVVVRGLLMLMTVGALFLWSYGSLLLIAWGGRAILMTPGVLALLFGYVYLLLSLYACFRKPSLKGLSVMAVLLNLPLAAFFIYSVSHYEDHLKLGTLVLPAFMLAWVFLCLTRWFLDSRISTGVQVITYTVATGLMLFGAVKIWPHMVDHESEALTVMRAAMASNGPLARAGFSEALRHASSISNKSRRSQVLQNIATSQARLGLYDDSTETIKLYLETDPEGQEKERLLSSIVMAQIDNKDYEAALATARKLDSYAVLQIQYFGFKAIDKAKEGHEEEARRIIDTAIALANEQKVPSTQTMQFMQIADALAKMGWHDAALASAQRSGTENSFILLGSIAVNEAKAGNTAPARQTMRVIQQTLELALKSCRSRKGVEERDQCLSRLVDELDDARFFNLGRSAARSISSTSKREDAFKRISDFASRFLNSDSEVLIKQDR
jgi:tetratricopeptide (TPR) repeat protein